METWDVSRDDDRARLRDATEQLKRAGLRNPDKLIRLGAAAMIEDCLAAWRAHPGTGTGTLAQMIMQGGPSDHDAGYVSTRQRILAEMNAWKAYYDDEAAA